MANKIVNTFETGLVKVPNKTKQPKNSYSYALNAVPNDEITDRSSRTNERGFDDYIQLKSQEYIIVGSQWLADEQYVFFIKHKEGATSPFNEIWYVDIKEGIQELKYSNLGLNFKEAYPITSTYRTDYRNHRIVYWVDGLNDDRVIDIDNPDVSSLDLAMISMNSSEIKADVSVESRDSGGAVKAGQYFVSVAYKDENEFVTGASSFTKPISISDNSYFTDLPVNQLNGIQYHDTNGIEGDVITNKKLVINVSNIDSRYKYVRIYIVQITDTVTRIYTSDDLLVSSSSVNFEFLGTNLEEDTSITINDLIVDRINYYASNIINQKENRLIRGNSKIKESLINYQQIANNIKVNYAIEEELVYDNYMFHDVVSDPLIQFFNLDSYSMSPEYLAKTGNTLNISSKTFMRDEVYALGISFELTNGTETDVFHIPGRALNTYTSTSPGLGEYDKAFSDQPHWDDDIISTDPVWTYMNTAIKRANGVNELAYWRSDLVYPDGYGYPTDGEQDNSNRSYIRHHKMPSEVLEPIIRTERSIDGESSHYKTYRRNIKLIISNIAIPQEYYNIISKVKIHYSPRRDTDKSIISKGLFFGASGHSTSTSGDTWKPSPYFNMVRDPSNVYQFISPDIDFRFKEFPIGADRIKAGAILKGYINYFGESQSNGYAINLVNKHLRNLNDANPPFTELLVGTCFYNESTVPNEDLYTRNVENIIFVDANSSGTIGGTSGNYLFTGEANTSLLRLGDSDELVIDATDYPELGFDDPNESAIYFDNVNYQALRSSPFSFAQHQLDSIYYDSVIYGSLVRDNRTQYGSIESIIYEDSGAYASINSPVLDIEVKNGDSFIEIHYTKKGYATPNYDTGYESYMLVSPPLTGYVLTGPISEIRTNSYIAYFVETDLNIRMRNSDPDLPNTSLDYFPLSPINATVSTVPESRTYYNAFEQKSLGEEYYNIYPFYNISSIKDYFPNKKLLVDFINPSTNIFENRLIYSDKQNYEDKMDSFRITRANNYKDLPMDRGAITQSFIKDDKFFVLTRDALFNVYASNKALQTLDGENMTVGTGEFFGLEPVELISIKGGFGGTSSKYSLSESPYGYLFIDRLKSKVILFNDQLKDINIEGLNEDYTLNLFKQFPELKINGDFDNPLIGPGIISIYDPRLHRLIISKKDYIALSEVVDNYKGLFNPNGVYAVGDIVAKDGVLVEITDIVEEYLIFTTLSNPSSFTFSLITTSAVAVNARDNNSVLDTTAVSSNANKTLNLSSGNTPIDINILASPSLVTSITANDRNIISVNTSIYDNLSLLDLDTNTISSINLSDNINLTGINIANNNLSVLDVSNNVNLTTLEADNNSLSTLDVSNNPQLKWYLAGFNNLSSVNLSNNPDIVWIRVRNNNLSTLNTSNCTLLERLEANNNNIPSFNFSSNPNITHLDIGNNPVSSLSLGNLSQLEILYVSACNLTTIDLSSNSNLVAIQIAENNLTTLDIFHLPNLQALDCTKNANLGGFNVSNNNQLTDLRCGECAFTADGADPSIIDAIIIKMDNNITSGGVLHYAASNSEGIQPTSASLAAYNSLISKGCDVRGKTPA